MIKNDRSSLSIDDAARWIKRQKKLWSYGDFEASLEKVAEKRGTVTPHRSRLHNWLESFIRSKEIKRVTKKGVYQTITKISKIDPEKTLGSVKTKKLLVIMYGTAGQCLHILNFVPKKDSRLVKESKDEIDEIIKAIEEILKDYGVRKTSDYKKPIRTYENKSESNRNLRAIDYDEFRKKIPIYEILDDCKEIMEKTAKISNLQIKKFLIDACTKIQRITKEIYKKELRYDIIKYDYDRNENEICLKLADYDLNEHRVGNIDKPGKSITDVFFDNHECIIKDIKYTPHPREPKTDITLWFRPHDFIIDETSHDITIIFDYYAEFKYIIFGKGFFINLHNYFESGT